MDVESLRRRLRESGADPDRVWLGTPAPDVPPPPEDVWALVDTGGDVVLGGVERAKFAEYGRYPSVAAAAEEVVRLLTQAPPGRPVESGLDAELVRRGSDLAARVARRDNGVPGPAHLEVGDLLDRFGPDTGRFAHPLGTPFPQRSLPPSSVSAPYHRYEVLADLGPGIVEGPVAPWFGQPGGGIQFVFPRPIRWYLDQGMLGELVPA